MTLCWTAQAGDHSWRVEVWEDGKLEASRSGSVKVSSGNLFGRLMPNVTSTVVSGTEVHFDVIVENKENYPTYNVPIRVFYTYIKPDGDFSDPVLVFERMPRQIDSLEVKTEWFTITLANPGEYYFALYVNGELEDEKTITVKSDNNIEAWIECSPEFVSEEDDSVACSVRVENLNGASVNVWIMDLYFAGGEIYDYSGVII